MPVCESSICGYGIILEQISDDPETRLVFDEDAARRGDFVIPRDNRGNVAS
jgi:hypothetical protein